MGAEVPGIPSVISGRNDGHFEANAAVHDVLPGAEFLHESRICETRGVNASPNCATEGIPDRKTDADVGGEAHNSASGHVSLASRELYHGVGMDSSGNGVELDAKDELGAAAEAGVVGRELGEEEEEEDEEEDDEDDVLEALDWVDLREGRIPNPNNDKTFHYDMYFCAI